MSEAMELRKSGDAVLTLPTDLRNSACVVSETHLRKEGVDGLHYPHFRAATAVCGKAMRRGWVLNLSHGDFSFRKDTGARQPALPIHACATFAYRAVTESDAFRLTGVFSPQSKPLKRDTTGSTVAPRLDPTAEMAVG